MPQVTINGNDYDVFADVATADIILGADPKRATAWEAREADDKARGLVAATRLLSRQSWVTGTPPLFDAVPVPVTEATAFLAADILANPELGDDASTGSNQKRVKAGSVEVEYFRPEEGTVLPSYVITLLADYIGSPASGDTFEGAAYGVGQRSRFDPTDYRLSERLD